MTRILILILALNAFITPVSIASACSLGMSNAGEPMSSMPVQMAIPASMSQSNTIDSDSGSDVSSAQIHCDNCVSKNTGDMSNMNCDLDCSVSCAVTSVVAMTSASLAVLPAVHAVKPVAGNFNIYTRSISPELHPPLV